MSLARPRRVIAKSASDLHKHLTPLSVPAHRLPALSFPSYRLASKRASSEAKQRSSAPAPALSLARRPAPGQRPASARCASRQRATRPRQATRTPARSSDPVSRDGEATRDPAMTGQHQPAHPVATTPDPVTRSAQRPGEPPDRATDLVYPVSDQDPPRCTMAPSVPGSAASYRSASSRRSGEANGDQDPQVSGHCLSLPAVLPLIVG